VFLKSGKIEVICYWRLSNLWLQNAPSSTQ